MSISPAQTTEGNSYTAAVNRLSTAAGNTKLVPTEAKTTDTTYQTALEPSGTLYLQTRVFRVSTQGEKLEKSSVDVLARYYRTITRPKTVERVTRAYMQLREAGETGSLVILSRRGKPLVQLDAKKQDAPQSHKVAESQTGIAMCNRRLSGEEFIKQVTQRYTKVFVGNAEQLQHALQYGTRANIEKVYVPLSLKEHIPTRHNKATPKVVLVPDVDMEVKQIDLTKPKGTGSARYDRDAAAVWNGISLPPHTKPAPIALEVVNAPKEIANQPRGVRSTNLTHNEQLFTDILILQRLIGRADRAALPPVMQHAADLLVSKVRELSGETSENSAPRQAVDLPSQVQVTIPAPAATIPTNIIAAPTFSPGALAMLERMNRRAGDQDRIQAEPLPVMAA